MTGEGHQIKSVPVAGAKEAISVFVSGATGFLGQHLVPLLLDRGFHLNLLVRNPDDAGWMEALQRKHTTGSLRLFEGDITDLNSISAAISGCQLAVHAAGLFRFWGEKAAFDAVNVEGTRNVAKAAAEGGVRRFVHISSLAVVGKASGEAFIDENTPCRPQDDYQRSKYAAEQVLMEYVHAYRMPAIILRPGAFYGPGSRYGFNRLFIEDPMRGLYIKVDGGRRIIFPVYVKDVAAAALVALTKDFPDGKPHGEIYNISDRPRQHNEINRIASQLLRIPSWRVNAPERVMILIAKWLEMWGRRSGREPFYPLNLRYYVFQDWRVSSQKAKEQLIFKPTPLEEGLKETISWYRSQGII